MIYCLYIQNDCELPACRCSGEDPTYDPDYDVKKYPQVESSIKTDLQISNSQSSPDDPTNDPDGNVMKNPQVYRQIVRQIYRHLPDISR